MARRWPMPSDEEFARQNEAAVREARQAERAEPRARSVIFHPGLGLVLVTLTSGFVVGFPPGRAPGLAGARPEQLAEVRISPSGDGLHWDALDAHVSLGGLLEEGLNLRAWAPRIMGRLTSEAKSRAARANGAKGGRPRRSAAA